MPNHLPTAEPARITVVESEACHLCDDARRTLEELSGSYLLMVETVDVRGDAGQQLIQVHRASMSPLVLLDGEFFSHGRLPRRKLTTVLEQRQSAIEASVGLSDG